MSDTTLIVAAVETVPGESVRDAVERALAHDGEPVAIGAYVLDADCTVFVYHTGPRTAVHFSGLDDRVVPATVLGRAPA